MSKPGWVWSSDPSEGWEGAADTREGAIAEARATVTGLDVDDMIDGISVAPVADTEIPEGERFVFTGKVEEVPWVAS